MCVSPADNGEVGDNYAAIYSPSLSALAANFCRPSPLSLSGEVGDIDFVDPPPRLRRTIAVPRCGEGMAKWALAAWGGKRVAAAREAKY